VDSPLGIAEKSHIFSKSKVVGGNLYGNMIGIHPSSFKWEIPQLAIEIIEI
jgi:hypothetical protein